MSLTNRSPRVLSFQKIKMLEKKLIKMQLCLLYLWRGRQEMLLKDKEYCKLFFHYFK